MMQFSAGVRQTNLQIRKTLRNPNFSGETNRNLIKI